MYNLPKWPACQVSGSLITEEQAMELLVRTDSWWLSTNDREWLEYLCEITGMESDFGMTSYESRQVFCEKYQVLDLYYMSNDQIASCYIWGPNGWCSWNGHIRQNDKNIGKWPTAEEVLEDWNKIATAFPFLDLRCQLFDREWCEEDPLPVVEYVVKNGRVEMRKPKAKLIFAMAKADNPLAFALHQNNPLRERGVNPNKLVKALKLIEKKLKN